MTDSKFHLVEYGAREEYQFSIIDSVGNALFKSSNPEEAETVFSTLKNYVPSDVDLDRYAMFVAMLRKVSEHHSPMHWCIQLTPKLGGYSILSRSGVVLATHPRVELMAGMITLARDIYG